MGHATAYEGDFHAWTEEQAARLRMAGMGGAPVGLDWDHLAEEIEEMGRSERGEMESRLIVLLLHLAKLAWSPNLAPRRMWRVTIEEQRRRLGLRMRTSPSLSRYPAQVLDECWDIARPKAEIELDIPEKSLPTVCPWMLDAEILNKDWLPDTMTR